MLLLGLCTTILSALNRLPFVLNTPEQYYGLQKVAKEEEADPRKHGRTRYQMTHKDGYQLRGRRPSLLVTARSGGRSSPGVQAGTGGPKSESKSVRVSHWVCYNVIP